MRSVKYSECDDTILPRSSLFEEGTLRIDILPIERESCTDLKPEIIGVTGI
jgi:hypothetical protein